MILRVFHLHRVTHIYGLDRCRDHLPLGIYRAMQSHRIEASTSQPFRYRYAIGNVWCEAKAVYGNKKLQSNLGHLLSQAMEVITDSYDFTECTVPISTHFPASTSFLSTPPVKTIEKISNRQAHQFDGLCSQMRQGMEINPFPFHRHLYCTIFLSILQPV